MQQPLISVIVPVYNVEPYLHQCIDSILAQTYENLEIILVDDGSTDGSPVICDEYARKDTRIRVIHKKNGGLSDARNAGLSIAMGEWIGFVDSDDYTAPEMYETLLRTAKEHNVDIVCCDCIKVYGESLKRDKPEAQSKLFSSEDAMRTFLFNYMVGEAAWDKLFRRALFNGLLFPVGEINEDLVTMPELIRRSGKVWYEGVAFYYYRQRMGSLSHSGYTEKENVILKHILRITEFVKKNYPAITSELACFQVRYASSMMARMIIGKNKDSFMDDYKGYRDILRKNYLSAFFCKKFSLHKKVLAFLLLTGTYKYYRAVRKLLMRAE